MTAPSAPGPHEAPRLSSRQQRILAGIEGDLTATDPALAHTMTWPAGIRGWWPISLAQSGSLVIGLLVLMIAAVLLPASWWALLAALTVLLVIPWMLLCTVERHNKHR